MCLIGPDMIYRCVYQLDNVCVYLYPCTCVYVYQCVLVCVMLDSHTYMHMYIHTHICIIHICMHSEYIGNTILVIHKYTSVAFDSQRHTYDRVIRVVCGIFVLAT
jgi:hypothetical protein